MFKKKSLSLLSIVLLTVLILNMSTVFAGSGQIETYEVDGHTYNVQVLKDDSNDRIVRVESDTGYKAMAKFSKNHNTVTLYDVSNDNRYFQDIINSPQNLLITIDLTPENSIIRTPQDWVVSARASEYFPNYRYEKNSYENQAISYYLQVPKDEVHTGIPTIPL